MRWKNFGIFICLLTLISGYQIAGAQQNLAQQAHAIFQQHCFGCHGEDGSFKEVLTIQHAELIAKEVVIPGNPHNSKLYLRLIEEDDNRRMPQNQPRLSDAAIDTIRSWIEAGAPDWKAIPEPKGRFITTEAMLKEIHNHVESLDDFDRPYARYFTLTHLYNAGATSEDLRTYQNALSKLINSLSWEYEVVKPIPIDPEGTILYIDLWDYGWEENDSWYKIEQVYPYDIGFKSQTYTTLRQKMDCEVPFVRADWFIAEASVSPFYYEILDLPKTARELEVQLGVNVNKNIQDGPGKRVWRAGFTKSGVSDHNRVVERHKSQYGAYWKTYDFSSSADEQDIFTHPLDFKHAGGEIIFNLPNGLQAYYLSNASGARLNEAPIDIVSDPGRSGPVIYNGLSCMGCHTEGMKTLEDEIRPTTESNPNPPYDREKVLLLYTEKSTMDNLIKEDTQRYRRAIEAAGGDFDGLEPIQQLVNKFEGELDADHAAAEVGLETDDFLGKIRENRSLANLSLQRLGLERGSIPRDTWNSHFSQVISVLDLYPHIVSSSTGLDLVPAVLSNRYTESSVRSVAFGPNGSILAIGDDDSVIQLWDVGTGEHLKNIVGREGYADTLAFGPNGSMLASIEIIVFDAEQRRINNGKTQDEAARLWDVNTGRDINGLTSSATFINVAFSADGNLISITADPNGDISSWSMYPKFGHLKNFIGHKDYVDIAVLSPDGKTLASGSRDRTIRLWDTVTGEHLKTLTGHNSGILSIAFNPDGRVLASGSDGEMRLWNAGTGQHMQTFADYTSDVSNVSFSVDGRILAGGSDGEILIWDVVTGRLLNKLLVDGYVNGIDFSTDGRMLASAAGGSLYLWDITLSTTSVPQTPQLADVNGDGSVNVQDLVLVASNFGKTGDNAADVNKDGMINITDLVLVAGALSDAAAAPSLWSVNSGATLTRTEVQQWLSEAEQLDLTDPITQRGIRFLQQFLAALTPKVTTLLPNYPNPFNPETWIPYQLSEPAEVTLTIYAVNGTKVRTLALGLMPAGIYESRSRAVYWGGKNDVGESVASGVYFYTLTAGAFTSTRKMLIRK